MAEFNNILGQINQSSVQVRIRACCCFLRDRTSKQSDLDTLLCLPPYNTTPRAQKMTWAVQLVLITFSSIFYCVIVVGGLLARAL